MEQQAADRIYRLGQKRDVIIHRFVCLATVEEKILQLQQRKLSLAKNILSGLVSRHDDVTVLCCFLTYYFFACFSEREHRAIG